MTSEERVIRALQRREPDRVPTFEWDINRRVGRALTGSDDPLEIVERLDLDGIAVRPDYEKKAAGPDTFVDEWGIRRRATGELIAMVTASPIRELADQAGYRFPDPGAPHRFAALERAARRFGGRRAVVLSVRDVFSDIRDLVGYENALVGLLAGREHFARLLDRAMAYNRALARIARERLGVGIIATGDDVADSRGLIMGPQVYFELLAPRFREVVRGFKDLGYTCIKHSDGDVRDLLDHWIESGVDCIDPIDPSAGLDIGAIKSRYGGRVCLKGNIDCQRTLVSGSEEEVRAEVRDCIRRAGRGGGLILSSSNTIHSGVRPENYRAMLEALRRYGRYPLAGQAGIPL